VWAEGWVEPAPSASEEWANSQGSTLLDKYFEKDDASTDLETGQPAEGQLGKLDTDVKVPEYLRRVPIGEDTRWEMPNSYVPPREADPYEEALKPFDLMNGTKP
jgi:hypothetical protein